MLYLAHFVVLLVPRRKHVFIFSWPEWGDKMPSLLLVCISLLVCHSAHGQVMLIVSNCRVDLCVAESGLNARQIYPTPGSYLKLL
jgi:hypothetical protein